MKYWCDIHGGYNNSSTNCWFCEEEALNFGKNNDCPYCLAKITWADHSSSIQKIEVKRCIKHKNNQTPSLPGSNQSLIPNLYEA